MSGPSTKQGKASPIPSPEELGFDPAVLRDRYTRERKVRLRPDVKDQYQRMKGNLAQYDADPHVAPGFSRDTLREAVNVVILGGGFGGLLAAARLRQCGVSDFRILEKAGDFGGTWYWNRYPGARCDVESYIYLPLLEETGSMPKEKYSAGPEILEHAQRIGQHFDLYDRACFQTQVRELRWDEEAARWAVTTDRDDLFRARFVILASGPLSRPKLPAIPGIEDFEGHSFHSSRWDYAYTGGDASGGLHKLSDQRVGLIGTGCSTVQAVAHLGADAKQLYVFQRTASSVAVRANRPTDPEWVETLTPGWQAHRNANFASILSGTPVEEDLVNDGWTASFKRLASILSPGSELELTDAELGQLSEISDFQGMNEIRDRVSSTVRDEATVEALKPWYGLWCKRPTFSDEYLPTFNRPNVQLVDTQGRGVERITENAVVVDGVAYAVDCIIYATGFEVGTAYKRRTDLEMYGRGGRTLTDYWADGIKTFQGFYTHGFPNCFHMGHLQTGAAPNFVYMLNGQATHIAHVIRRAMERDLTSLEATSESEKAWVELVHTPTFMTKYQSRCTPGYYNGEGKNDGTGFFENLYPDGAVLFQEMLARWRDDDCFEGLAVRQGLGGRRAERKQG